MRAFAQFDQLVPPDQVRAAQRYFAASVRWEYGWPQGPEDPFSHWNVDFLEAALDNDQDLEDKLRGERALAPLSRIWDTLKEGPTYGHHLVRCYANAHTYGVEGHLHTDSKRSDHHTVLIYLNPVWKPD